VYKDAIARFVVNAQKLDRKGEGNVVVHLVQPDGRKMICPVNNTQDGLYHCVYSPQMEGLHQLEITYEGVAIPGSPHMFSVVKGFDVSRVKVFGEGVNSTSAQPLLSGQKTQFTVDVAGAGPGGLALAVEGPTDAPFHCTENGDGTFTVDYTPSCPGTYKFNIKYGDHVVPGSPFYVNVRGKTDPSHVKCFGPGLNSDNIRVGQPSYFTIDASNAGDGPIQASSLKYALFNSSAVTLATNYTNLAT
ncbi:hypothetical protein Ciccas_008320, partial [Cichlidogyrus casuarinus]